MTLEEIEEVRKELREIKRSAIGGHNVHIVVLVNGLEAKLNKMFDELVKD